MSGYIGDFTAGARIDDDITLVASDGTPTAVTSGSLCVRRMNTLTLAPAGAVLSTSGGLAHIIVFTASASTFFVSNADYTVFFGNGTVGGTSVVGYVTTTFSLSNRTIQANVLYVNGQAAILADASAVADAVWDEARSGHVSGGTYGEAIPAVISTVSANIKEILDVVSSGAPGYVGIDWANRTGTATINSNIQNIAGSGTKGSAGYVGIDWASKTSTATIQAGNIAWGTFTGTAFLNADVRKSLGVAWAGTAGYAGLDWSNTTGTTFVKTTVTATGFDWANVTGTATVNANVQNVQGAGSKGSAGYVGLDWAQTTGTATVQAGSIAWGTFTGTTFVNADVRKWLGVAPNPLIAARVDANTQALATGVIDAASIAADAGNEIADALLDRTDAIETGLTVRQAHRLEAAATAGKLSGAATTTVTIRNSVADSKDRIVATVDSDGNRTAITTDVS